MTCLLYTSSGSLEEIETLLDDFNRSLAEYTDSFSFDEQQMRQTEERLDLINRLKTKYGQSVPEILDYAKEKQARIEILNDYDSYLEQLQRDYESSQKEFSRLADEISGIRKQYAGICLLYTSLRRSFMNLEQSSRRNAMKTELNFEL